MSIRGSYRLRYINIMQKGKKREKTSKIPVLFSERVSQKTDAFTYESVGYTIIYHWALSVE